MKSITLKKEQLVSRQEGRQIERNWTENLPKSETTLEAIEQVFAKFGNEIELE